ncbi:MAG: phosphoribosylamine--glycine ligase [Treponema sp.]|nr:phosphoribosylamine--glycine ligase [Spirochaetia bacterium]MDD7458953.1 phosphoribosylamine--glycine ligase [Spirochaetales bacterium]MDY5811092.1 phosphoribosylamine--glycine ligase [Treponema sp.]
MKVIVVGNGGREHAIAWKLAQSSSVEEVICTPGNGGTALENKCRNVAGKTHEDFLRIAKENNCDLCVVGPEDPLCSGLSDEFWKAGIATVGTKQLPAQLEGSKDFAKNFMHKYGVACADNKTFTDKAEALAYVKAHGAPIVLKADGLAAGKGVVVALNMEDALKAVEELMEGQLVGDAGRKLVIEEYMRGVEISILGAVSVNPELTKAGKSCIVPFMSARDHKRLLDGAKGPNTGGMGAICPVDDVTDKILEQFNKNILEPTLKGIEAEGWDYRGFIFFGLMITKEGPKVIEYNVRLGDPETQAVLPLMDFDFAQMCKAITDGTLKDFKTAWKPGYVVAPVAVSGGYPKAYKKGMTIKIDEDKIAETGAKVFFAGAMEDRRAGGGIATNGGRVLACAAQGNTFDEAWNKAYDAIKHVNFDGMFYRKDIGLPGAAESN